MSRLSNTEIGRGYTHKIKIDLDQFNQVSGNADQTVRLFAGDNAHIRRATIYKTEALTSGANTITAKIGDSGDDDGFVPSKTISGATLGVVETNGGAKFKALTADITTSVTSALVTGSATLVGGGKVLFSGYEEIAAGGTSTALSLATHLSNVDSDAGGDIFTLADGDDGQLKTVYQLSSTGTSTITPANLLGGTSVTMDTAGQSVQFQFSEAGTWVIVGGNGYTVVP